MGNTDAASRGVLRTGSTAQGPLRVLFIDDEAVVVEPLTRLLELDGFLIDWAADGETGLALARSRSYDAIILDLRLPGMPGLEMLRRLRLDGVWTPVLILTGFPDVDSALEAGGAGAMRYLRKPVDAKDLGEALRTAVAAAKPRMLKVYPLFAPLRSARSECISSLLRHLERLGFSAEATGTTPDDASRTDLLRLLADAAANRSLAFLEFVAVVNALKFVSSRPALPLSVGVRKIRELIEDASAGRSPHVDPRIEPILVRIETAGRNSPKATEAEVAARFELASHELWQLLTAEIGLTFTKCQRAIVMRQAVRELVSTNEDVRQIAFRLGYKAASNLDRDFHDVFGVTPTEFRRLQ